MQAVKTLRIYGDELEKVKKKIRVETINYNCIDVRGFEDDGETWLFLVDLKLLLDQDVNSLFQNVPISQKRTYSKERLLNSGLLPHSSGVRVLKESYFLNCTPVQKKDQKAFVCYQCGREIQQGPVVKRKFSVCHDGATEKRIARFHYVCFGG